MVSKSKAITMIIYFSVYQLKTKWKNIFNYFCKIFLVVGLSFLIYYGCESHDVNNNLNHEIYPGCNGAGCLFSKLMGEIMLTNINFLLKSEKTYQIQISMGTCTLNFSKKVINENNTLIFSLDDMTRTNCWTLSISTIADVQKKMIKMEFNSNTSHYILGERKTFFMNLKMFENETMIVNSGEIEISNLSEHYPNGAGCEPICYRVTTTISLRESKDE